MFFAGLVDGDVIARNAIDAATGWGIEVTRAYLSPTRAFTLIGFVGRVWALLAGGFCNMSCIIASAIGPGARKTSPGSRTGVMTAFGEPEKKVSSSRCVTDDPSS